MSRRALVTGGSGFVGQWLARALLGRGWEVHSVGVHGAEAATLLTAEERESVTWHVADLRDGAALGGAVAEARPEFVAHLAAVSFLPEAAASSVAAFDVNVLGLARLLEAIRPRRHAGEIDPLILVVGSGEQYGRHPDDALPLDESAAQRPLTVYAASKAAQEHVALQAARAEGMRIVATRSFNHSGPGQSPRFLLPALVSRVRALPRGERGVLPMGNLTPIRDFLHVADVVEGYCRLVDQGEPGEVYNVASGQGISVGALVDRVLQRAGVSADISQDAALMRPVDLPALVGDSSKLQRTTGWRPRRSLDDIIDDLLSHP